MLSPRPPAWPSFKAECQAVAIAVAVAVVMISITHVLIPGLKASNVGWDGDWVSYNAGGRGWQGLSRMLCTVLGRNSRSSLDLGVGFEGQVGLHFENIRDATSTYGVVYSKR